jgi:hypothetical protein
LAFHSGRETDHSPPSSAEVKELVELYFHSPNTPSWRGAQGEHRTTLTQTDNMSTKLQTALCTMSLWKRRVVGKLVFKFQKPSVDSGALCVPSACFLSRVSS